MRIGRSMVSTVWSSIIWIKDLFFAKEDTSGMISGQNFRHVFMSRVEELGI